MHNEELHIYGGKALIGDVTISGSKNSALACIFGASLVNGPVVLHNIPQLSDIDVIIDILKNSGKQIERSGTTLKIDGSIKKVNMSQKLASKIRASIYALGLFLATVGKAEIPLPGGDKIGDRPVDIHLECLKELGVRYSMKKGIISAEMTENISHNEVFLRYPSVGATCNFMLVASTIPKKITLRNAAKEPEIIDLVNLLTKFGVSILGAGSDSITITGIDMKRTPVLPVHHEIIPDRIETGMMMVAIAITQGEGYIHHCVPAHNLALISILKKAGVIIESNDNDILFVKGAAHYQPVNVVAMPYPGFPTDLQPILTVFSQRCTGESVISDLVFPERFTYVSELRKMGARIIHNSNSIYVKGGNKLQGMHVEGNDIRSVVALICAALIAKGNTTVVGIEHLKRGHENLCDKLKALGAEIEMH